VLARRDNEIRGLNQETDVSAGGVFVEDGFDREIGRTTGNWICKYVQMAIGSRSNISDTWRRNDHDLFHWGGEVMMG
jgi:hypothetical protein